MVGVTKAEEQVALMSHQSPDVAAQMGIMEKSEGCPVNDENILAHLKSYIWKGPVCVDDKYFDLNTINALFDH